MENTFEGDQQESGGQGRGRTARLQLSPGILSRSGTEDGFEVATRSSSTCPSGQFPTPPESLLSDKLGGDEAVLEKLLLEAACAAPRLHLRALPLAEVRARLAELAATPIGP